MNVLKHLMLVVFVLFFFAGCSSPEEKVQEFYEKGMQLFEKGELSKAGLEFRNALKIDKKKVEAWYGLALIAEKQGKWKDYYGLLNKVIEIKQDHLEAQLALGRIYLVGNRLEQAMQVNNKLLELAPKKPDILALKANLLLKLEDYKGAIEAANQALAIDANSTHALYVLASERLIQDDLAGSASFIKKGLAVNPEEVSLLLLKAKVAQSDNDTEELIGVLKQLVQIQPENRTFQQTLLKVYMTTGRKAEAEQLLVSALERNPEDVNAIKDFLAFVKTEKGIDAAIVETEKIIAENPDKEEYQFFLIDLYLKSGKADLAQEKLKSLSQTAKNAEVKVRAKSVMLSQLLQKKADKAEIIKLNDEILSEDPQNVQALLVKATDQISNQKYDEAVSSLRTILRDTPDSAIALRMLGQTHELAGDIGLAEDMYARAFEASKQAPEYGLLYANKLIAMKRSNQAISVLEDSLQVSPDNLLLLARLAQLHVANRDWIKAQEVNDRIRELKQGSEISYQLQGIISEGLKDYDESIESFKKAYESFPGSTRPLVSLVRTYVRAQRYDEAEGFLDNVLKTSPANDNARLLKARLLSVQKKNQEAVNIYQDLIKKRPNNANLYNELARLHLIDKQPQKALSVFDEAIKAIPENLGLLLAKAGVQEGSRDYEGAIMTYEQALKIKPDAAVAVNNLASLLSEHRDDAQSLERAAELAAPFKNVAIPQFVDTLGWIYHKQGKYQEANELLLKSVEKAPNDIGILYHLGTNYESLDDPDNARVQYQKILEIAGDRKFLLRDKVEEALSRIGNEPELKAAVNQ